MKHPRQRTTRLPLGRTALLLAVAVVSAACSPPARDTDVAAGAGGLNRSGSSSRSAAGAPGSGGFAADGTPLPGADGTVGGLAAPGAGDTTVAGAPGSPIGSAAGAPGGTPGGGPAGGGGGTGAPGRPTGALAEDPGLPGGGATYQGVTADTIKVAFHWNADGCGADVNERLTNFSSDPATTIPPYIEWINRHADDGTLMDGYPIDLHGRKLEAVFVPSGGPTCPEVSRAGAIRMAEEEKVFAAVGSTLSFDEDVVAATLAERKVPHFGSAFLSEPGFYATRDPFVHSLYSSGTVMVRHLADYLNQRLAKGQRPPNSRVTGPRVYGLLYPNTANARTVVDEFKGFLGGDVKIASEFAYDADFAQATTQAGTAIARFRGAAVNTVIMLTDPVTPIAFTNVASQQRAEFDYVVSSFGYMDTATAAVNFAKDQWSHAFGVSDFGPETQGSVTEQKGRPFNQAWQDVRPGTEPPDDAVVWYATIANLVWGISAAGPNLNPQTMRAGLVDRVETFRPTNYRVDYRPDTHGAIDDFGIVHYDPTAVDQRDEPNSQGNRRGKFLFDEGDPPRRYTTGQRM